MLSAGNKNNTQGNKKMNIYPVIITSEKTEIGYANWGKNADARAKDQALQMRADALRKGEFVYEVKFATAKTRKEVQDAYEI
jgi:hypothetical protein